VSTTGDTGDLSDTPEELLIVPDTNVFMAPGGRRMVQQVVTAGGWVTPGPGGGAAGSSSSGAAAAGGGRRKRVVVVVPLRVVAELDGLKSHPNEGEANYEMIPSSLDTAIRSTVCFACF
jgi:hypothetical protein